MKRYMLFGFLGYYPSGGMNDFIFDFDTKEEFKEEFDGLFCDYYNVADLEGKEVRSVDMSHYALREWVEENVE